MTIARLYRMEAAEGKEQALLEALTTLANQVRQIEGSEGVELLRDLKRPGSFTFIEKWASVEAHKGAAANLPKDAFAPVSNALAGPPEGTYLDYLLAV